MSGALLQLASLGTQDVYLTSNPEITLFKKAYLRYTNFSIETVQVTFDGGVINFGMESTATLEQSGDLISKVVLVLKLDRKVSRTEWGYVNRLGHAVIDNIKIRIGQSDIDIHYNDWINTYYDLTSNRSHLERYNIMIGNIPELKNLQNEHDYYTLYIPLNFWFCKTTNLSYPICALINQQFQIIVKLRESIDCINYRGIIEPNLYEIPQILSGYLLVDYVYLENEERHLFKTNNHEYIIEQVQDMTDTIVTQDSRINLIFDHPCKYLVWFINLNRYYERHAYLVWCIDDIWENSRNLFAKLVWLATRRGLTVTDCNSYILYDTSYVNIGHAHKTLENGSCVLKKLADKVDAILLFADVQGENIVAEAIPDNVILTTNNITIQDMSLTIDELLLNDATDEQIAFVNKYIVSVIDIFNTGNYINGIDSPIKKSAFLINGKNRFQERDSIYYNYVQPYYYFTNAPAQGINVYSFSIEPENVQPTGTINLGNINSKDLILNLGIVNDIYDSYIRDFFKSGRLRIFVVNYTVLKIVDGQSLLVY